MQILNALDRVAASLGSLSRFGCADTVLFRTKKLVQLSFAAVMQLQSLVQPVENDLILVRQLAGLAMILSPILGVECDKLFRNFQRVIDLLRLAQEKHVRIALQNEAGTLNPSRDALHRVLLNFRHEIDKTRNPEGPDTICHEPAQCRVVLHDLVDDFFEGY